MSTIRGALHFDGGFLMVNYMRSCISLTIGDDAFMYMLLAVSIVIAISAYICMDNELDVGETVQKIVFNGSITLTLYIGISVVIPDLIFR